MSAYVLCEQRNDTSMRISPKRVLGLAAVALALAWSLSGVDFGEVVLLWIEADRALVAGVVGLTLCDVFVRSWAWKVIVNPMKTVPLLQVFRVYIIGLFSGLVLPFRMGDVAQGYLLGRKESLSKVSTISTVAVRRLFEVVSLTILMGGLTLGFSLDFPFAGRGALLAIILALGSGVAWMLVRYRRHVLRLLDRIISRLSRPAALRVQTFFSSVLQGAVALRDIRTVGLALLLSLVAWGVEIVMIKTAAAALGISLDYLAAGVVLVTINIGLMVSPTPGNIGSYQFLCILALSWYSVSKSRALSFSILFQVLQGLPIVICGPVFLALEANRAGASPAPNQESR